jgi:hypothetical protein
MLYYAYMTNTDPIEPSTDITSTDIVPSSPILAQESKAEEIKIGEENNSHVLTRRQE